MLVNDLPILSQADSVIIKTPIGDAYHHSRRDSLLSTQRLNDCDQLPKILLALAYPKVVSGTDAEDDSMKHLNLPQRLQHTLASCNPLDQESEWMGFEMGRFPLNRV